MLYDITKDFIKAINDCFIDSIDIETAGYLVETLDVMISEICKKNQQGVDVRMI